jgi:hypothetical protein
MADYVSITTDAWSISVPSDWSEKNPGEREGLYLESSDTEKGCYLVNWVLRESGRDAALIAARYKETCLKALRSMPDHVWNIVEDRTFNEEMCVVSILDAFDRGAGYRITEKIMTLPSVAVVASFHDYACADYAKSKAFFDPIVNSFRLAVHSQLNNPVADAGGKARLISRRH